MKKNDKMLRCDYESYTLLQRKQKKMEDVASSLINKKVKIPLKQVLKVMAEKPFYLDDSHLLHLAKEKNKRKWY